MGNKSSRVQTEADNNYDFSIFSIHHKSFLGGIITSAIILFCILGSYFYRKNKMKNRKNGECKRKDPEQVENQSSI